MSEPFIAEIRIFAGNFAPRSWAFCNGQSLPVDQNTALFSLIGTTYGGDGRTTTALPNLQGRAPMHPGRGPGLTARRLGEKGGVDTVTLAEAQMPSHTHSMVSSRERGDNLNPANNFLARGTALYASPNNLGAMADQALPKAGGERVDTDNGGTIVTTYPTQAHNNLQPLIAINYIIALQGLYPSRS